MFLLWSSWYGIYWNILKGINIFLKLRLYTNTWRHIYIFFFFLMGSALKIVLFLLFNLGTMSWSSTCFCYLIYILTKGLFVLFCFFQGCTPVYGGSQDKGWIGAAAAGLCHSHSNTRSEPCPATYTIAHGNSGFQPTERGQGSNPCPRGY